MMTSEDLYAEDGEILSDDERPNGENLEDGGDEANTNEEGPPVPEDGTATAQVVKPKRVVRNPQPKLNVDTLRGKKGLMALESYFDNVKYQGRGHEEEDLSTILKTYAYWCHRLFPKYPFDETISKIEKLGNKKIVKTYIKKIRLGMITDADDDLRTEAVLANDDSGAEDFTPSNDFGPGENIDDQFDNLFNHEPVVPTPAPEPLEITEELQERIRQNKERAEKLRQERLRKVRELDNSSSNEPSMSRISEIEQSQTESFCTTQNEQSSDEEVDIDNIFNKIQPTEPSERVSSTSLNKSDDEEMDI